MRCKSAMKMKMQANEEADTKCTFSTLSIESNFLFPNHGIGKTLNKKGYDGENRARTQYFVRGNESM
jgi:hypothetical protein